MTQLFYFMYFLPNRVLNTNNVCACCWAFFGRLPPSTSKVLASSTGKGDGLSFSLRRRKQQHGRRHHCESFLLAVPRLPAMLQQIRQFLGVGLDTAKAEVSRENHLLFLSKIKHDHGK